MRILLLLALLLPTAPIYSQLHSSEDFSQYWTSKRIEVNHYDLVDSSGAPVGKATLRFCVENFSRSKQVHLADAQRNPLDVVQVMGAHLRVVDGGDNEYTALSTFTPTQRDKHPHSIKATASVQSTTGQLFAQINLQTYKYRMLQFSHIEQEADQEHVIEKAYLENEFFNLVRTLPHDQLPTGAFSLVPSLLHLRPSRVLEAEGELLPDAEKPDDLWVYSLKYGERSLHIRFQKRFPHLVEGWEEWQGGVKQVAAQRTQSTHEEVKNEK